MEDNECSKTVKFVQTSQNEWKSQIGMEITEILEEWEA